MYRARSGGRKMAGVSNSEMSYACKWNRLCKSTHCCQLELYTQVAVNVCVSRSQIVGWSCKKPLEKSTVYRRVSSLALGLVSIPDLLHGSQSGTLQLLGKSVASALFHSPAIRTQHGSYHGVQAHGSGDLALAHSLTKLRPSQRTFTSSSSLFRCTSLETPLWSTLHLLRVMLYSFM